MKLAKHKERLPHFAPLNERGTMTVHDALKAAPGEERDNVIRAWSASVWRAYKDLHPQVKAWVDTELGTKDGS